MKLTTQVKKKSKHLDATRAKILQQVRTRHVIPTPKVRLLGLVAMSFAGGFILQRASGFVVTSIRDRAHAIRQSVGSIRGLILALRQQLLMIQPILKMFT